MKATMKPASGVLNQTCDITMVPPRFLSFVNLVGNDECKEFIYQIIYQNYHLVGALAPTFVEILCRNLVVIPHAAPHRARPPGKSVWTRFNPSHRRVIHYLDSSLLVSLPGCVVSSCLCPFFLSEIFRSFFFPLNPTSLSAQAGRSGSIGALARPVPSQVGNVSVSHHSGSCLLVA